jgi:D-beta-D-heptose 7-phosphate kinase / D-beta-D-heptose 1-phosphate adenosyltransferase
VTTLVVVGDVLLDVDIETTADRLSPDGPAPVLDEQQRVERPGGAALAALFAARSHSGPVVLVAPLADDEAARRIRELLDPRIELLAVPADGQTPVKTRLRSAGTTVARLDRGSGVRVAGVPPEVAATLRGAGAVLVSDYGGGATATPELHALLAETARRVPMVWDPHPRGSDPVPRTTLVTPNAREAARAAGGPADGQLADLRRQAQHLLESWQARAVAVTIGARGALFVDGSGRTSVVPPIAQAAGDPCGAGDCFAAAVTVALAEQALPSEAVARGVARAGEYLLAGGVAGLARADEVPSPAPTSAEELAAAARARGETVVATGGCFDLLHAGHVAMLAAARRLGDCLIVCLNSDDSVRRLKGPSRPLQTAEDRAQLLLALRCVDAVVVFDEDTPNAAIERIRPAVWVKGDDYAGTELPETALVRSWGGEVVTVPYLDGRSTSGLVELSRR